MRTVEVDGFAAWRRAARQLALEGIAPEEVSWNGEGGGSALLALDLGPSEPGPTVGKLAVPPDFVRRAEVVACHAALDTWGLLYRLLWRMAIRGERTLLRRPNDGDVRAFELKGKAVRRERHKMTAFVRFRKVDAGGEGDREAFVAWHEPEHDVVRLAAPFFRDRFATMDWSILTPRTCVHWDGRQLRFTEGAKRDEAPVGDELESYWKRYYSSIFNPARLNMRMMEREMPRRYWKNLPEAELIEELATNAYGRVEKMADADAAAAKVARRKPAGAPDGKEYVSCQSPEEIRLQAEGKTLDELARLAATCQACGLCWDATQTVFGEGPRDARLVIVGEQPGDREDIEGRAFVGPAGGMLDEGLAVAGLQRSGIYVTNAVKHFKWKAAGKRRLHQKPTVAEMKACKPWLEAELAALRPEVVVCLGSTAARAVLGREVSVTSERGVHDDPGLPYRVVLTYHPSYLLRLQEEVAREDAWMAFCRDLAMGKALLEEAEQR